MTPSTLAIIAKCSVHERASLEQLTALDVSSFDRDDLLHVYRQLVKASLINLEILIQLAQYFG